MLNIFKRQPASAPVTKSYVCPKHGDTSHSVVTFTTDEMFCPECVMDLLRKNCTVFEKP